MSRQDSSNDSETYLNNTRQSDEAQFGVVVASAVCQHNTTHCSTIHVRVMKHSLMLL